jgi:septal ring factor EnvC (AmiA/AmiB activator)
MPRRTAAGLASFGSLNYRAIEAEVIKLTELLHAISKKSKLVRKSLAYLEKEQKKVTRQLREAKKFLNQVKNRSIQVLRGFPGNAEEIYYQLKGEFNRLSKRLGVR